MQIPPSRVRRTVARVEGSGTAGAKDYGSGATEGRISLRISTEGFSDMIRTTAYPLATCLALLALAAGSPDAAADGEAPVLMKELKSPRTPGKVETVLWTVRAEACTLQVVFPNLGRIGVAKFTLPRPAVQVWLLKADGTLIAPTRRAEPGTTAGDKNPRQPYGVEVLFAFPRSADKEAVAAAIRIDDAFYIEPLKTLVNARG